MGSQALRVSNTARTLLLITGLILLVPVAIYAILQVNGTIVVREMSIGVPGEPTLQIPAATYPWAVLALCSFVDGLGLIIFSEYVNRKAKDSDCGNADGKLRVVGVLREIATILLITTGYITVLSTGYFVFGYVTRLEPPNLTGLFLYLVLFLYTCWLGLKNRLNLSAMATEIRAKVSAYGFLLFLTLVAYLVIWVDIGF